MDSSSVLAQAVSGCFAVRFGIPCGVLAVGLCLAPTSGASTAVGIFRLGRFRHPPIKLGGGLCFRGIGAGVSLPCTTSRSVRLVPIRETLPTSLGAASFLIDRLLDAVSPFLLAVEPVDAVRWDEM